MNGFKQLKNKWAKREKLASRIFDEWECTMVDVIKDRIKSKHRRSKNQVRKQVLKEE